MKNVLPQFESLPAWVLVTSPIFLLVFLAIIFLVYRKGSKKKYEHAERLPLEDDV